MFACAGNSFVQSWTVNVTGIRAVLLVRNCRLERNSTRRTLLQYPRLREIKLGIRSCSPMRRHWTFFRLNALPAVAFSKWDIFSMNCTTSRNRLWVGRLKTYCCSHLVLQPVTEICGAPAFRNRFGKVRKLARCLAVVRRTDCNVLSAVVAAFRCFPFGIESYVVFPTLGTVNTKPKAGMEGWSYCAHCPPPSVSCSGFDLKRVGCASTTAIRLRAISQ